MRREEKRTENRKNDKMMLQINSLAPGSFLREKKLVMGVMLRTDP